MAMQLCRNVRLYANKFSTASTERFSVGARSYSRWSIRFSIFANNLPALLKLADITGLFQTPGLPKPAATILEGFRTAVIVSGSALYLWSFYCFPGHLFRELLSDLEAGKKEHAMHQKLERGNYESAEAYFEVLDREFNALKLELSNRPDLSKMGLLKREAEYFQLCVKKREASVLEDIVGSWAEKLD